ncbi:MAG TPA: hypothetical protein VHZ81_09795 [Galbitalea sp.]|nr:hypothetical protein [Galbitalea sp.]
MATESYDVTTGGTGASATAAYTIYSYDNADRLTGDAVYNAPAGAGNCSVRVLPRQI